MREHWLSADNPLDLAIIDDFIDRLATDVGIPAILLAADRRGKTMTDFGRALVTALVAAAPRRFDRAQDRAEFLGDLADSADHWGFAERYADRSIEGVFRGCRDLDGCPEFEEEAVIMLLDSVGSLGREGYNLHWLAGRISRTAGIPWHQVLVAANDITNSEARAAREALLQ